MGRYSFKANYFDNYCDFIRYLDKTDKNNMLINMGLRYQTYL